MSSEDQEQSLAPELRTTTTEPEQRMEWNINHNTLPPSANRAFVESIQNCGTLAEYEWLMTTKEQEFAELYCSAAELRGASWVMECLNDGGLLNPYLECFSTNFMWIPEGKPHYVSIWEGWETHGCTNELMRRSHEEWQECKFSLTYTEENCLRYGGEWDARMPYKLQCSANAGIVARRGALGLPSSPNVEDSISSLRDAVEEIGRTNITPQPSYFTSETLCVAAGFSWSRGNCVNSSRGSVGSAERIDVTTDPSDYMSEGLCVAAGFLWSRGNCVNSSRGSVGSAERTNIIRQPSDFTSETLCVAAGFLWSRGNCVYPSRGSVGSAERTNIIRQPSDFTSETLCVAAGFLWSRGNCVYPSRGSIGSAERVDVTPDPSDYTTEGLCVASGFVWRSGRCSW